MTKEEDQQDADFRAFARACRPFWKNCGFQKELLAAVGGDRDLAVVIYHHLGEDAFGWLDRRIPALRGGKPRNFLRDPARLRRLKMCLHSMW